MHTAFTQTIRRRQLLADHVEEARSEGKPLREYGVHMLPIKASKLLMMLTKFYALNLNANNGCSVV